MFAVPRARYWRLFGRSGRFTLGSPTPPGLETPAKIFQPLKAQFEVAKLPFSGQGGAALSGITGLIAVIKLPFSGQLGAALNGITELIEVAKLPFSGQVGAAPSGITELT